VAAGSAGAPPVSGAVRSGPAERPSFAGVIRLGTYPSAGRIVGTGSGGGVADENAICASWILALRDLREAVAPVL